MDGKRIRDYWSTEMDALVQTYRQFELMIPAPTGEGAHHRGEDGRFVEDLIREYLRRYLPRDLEVLTGFILRPAVKTGEDGTERKAAADCHSTQLDIIVFDSGVYPIFQRFGDSVIVPPEGVVAILSVKKHLNDSDIELECGKLFDAASLCKTLYSNDPCHKVRGPFLSLIGVKSKIEKKNTETLDWIFKEMECAYAKKSGVSFDQLIGFLGALDSWSIFKRRPNMNQKAATFIGFKHSDEEAHLGLQFMITGILSVYYDKTRRNVRRPGFTAFPKGRPYDRKLGEIPYERLR